VYPRYELEYTVDPLDDAVTGVRTVAKRVGLDDLPVLAIGYSRGGALVLEYAAVAARDRVPVPDKIMSIFPAGRGDYGKLIDLKPLERHTGLLLMIGQQDTIVGKEGARALLQRLQAGGFPAANIDLDFVASHGAFVADHLAPLRTTTAAKAAFWRPADRLLAKLD
jgi:dienelactone hydrolase